jgi:hypothetical protein
MLSEIVFADTIRNVSYANGVLRVSLGRQNGEDTVEDAGVLVMPITQAGNFVNALGRSLKELEAKVRELQSQQQSGAAQAESAGGDEQGRELDFGRSE